MILESSGDDSRKEKFGRLEAPRPCRKLEYIRPAKAGDTCALRLCLDRLMPPQRDRCVYFDLPPNANLEGISQGITSIAAAISEGKITPQEGEVLFRILSGHANIMVSLDLERRVQKLEQGALPRGDSWGDKGALERAV
jgi:hypothetical protein